MIKREWYTAKEVAVLFGVRVQVLSGWVKRGLKCYKLSAKQRLFRLDEVQSWIMANGGGGVTPTTSEATMEVK